MERLMTLNRLSSHFRLPREWLRNQALAGKIPCLRVGRRLLFNPVAVECALADQAASSREVSHAG